MGLPLFVWGCVCSLSSLPCWPAPELCSTHAISHHTSGPLAPDPYKTCSLFLLQLLLLSFSSPHIPSPQPTPTCLSQKITSSRKPSLFLQYLQYRLSYMPVPPAPLCFPPWGSTHCYPMW